MKKKITIATVIGCELQEEANEINKGAMLYINEHPHICLVEVFFVPGQPPVQANWDQIDGLIAWADERDKWILEIPKPKINCTGAFPVDKIPIVSYHGNALFAQAAEQAARLKIRELLFLRDAIGGELRRRSDAILQGLLTPLGINFSSFNDISLPNPVIQVQRLQFPDPALETLFAERLGALRKPAMILADSGIYGRFASKMARHWGFSIPQEIAILVLGDSRHAQTADPPLSVIPMSWQQLGFEAIKRLHAEIEPQPGQTLPQQVLLSPAPAILRASTDRPPETIHIEQAEELIGLYAGNGLTVQELADQMKLHRCHFARQFTRHYGKSPLQAIQEERLRQICGWLANTALAMHRIAELSGFRSNVVFNRFFKKQTGMTPTEYRRKQNRRKRK